MGRGAPRVALLALELVAAACGASTEPVQADADARADADAPAACVSDCQCPRPGDDVEASVCHLGECIEAGRPRVDLCGLFEPDWCACLGGECRDTCCYLADGSITPFVGEACAAP